MPLDPQAKNILDLLAAMPPVDYSTLTAAEYRALLPGEHGPVADARIANVEDRAIPGPGGPLPIRIYHPEGKGPFPITVFFHGGGFVACGLDSHDNICRHLADRAGSLVISVDYRLAPEAKFPAAVYDAYAAVQWAYQHAAQIGGIAAAIAVAGDSAGGNLAAVVSQQCRHAGPAICHQLLLYPVMDCRFDTDSYRDFAHGYLLSTDMMRWFWDQYLPDQSAADDVLASPLRQADLRGLPATTIFTPEYDPLRDEGESYGRALQAAGVACELQRWPGQFHGFISMVGAVDAAGDALSQAAQALRRSFAAARSASEAAHSPS